MSDATTRIKPQPSRACSHCDGIWPLSLMASESLCKACDRYLARKSERERQHAEYARIHPEGP